jgi:ribosomal protein L11 methyltransferase
VRVLELQVPIADAELAADRLWSAGAQAVEEFEPNDGIVCLRTVLAADHDQSADRLGPLGADWTLTHVDVDDEPAQTWREFATPMEISPTLVIAPAWQPSPPAVLGRLTVVIEPGGAFGLGDHPTTRLSAAAAERLRTTGRVLDVGCGTGVLAIIAALNGAGPVVAIDIAEAAVEATVDNARRNGVESMISVSTTPLDELDGHFDVVLANVLAPALVAMAPHLRRVTSPSGSLVISGVLADGYDHVVRSLEPMIVARVDVLDGWAAVELNHPRLNRPQLDRPGRVAGSPP